MPTYNSADRCQTSATATGVGGTVTAGTAQTGFRTFAAAITAGTHVAGDNIDYVLENAGRTTWEVRWGAIGSGGTTLTYLGTRASSTGSAIDWTGAGTLTCYETVAGVRVTPLKVLDSGSAGFAINAGTLTVSDPFVFAQTWNEGSSVFSGVKIDITNTASNITSLPLDIQVNAASYFRVSRIGALTISNGTLNASAPGWQVNQGWSSGGTTFTGALINVTDTASASGSMLADFQVGGSTKLNVLKSGGVRNTQISGMMLERSSSASLNAVPWRYNVLQYPYTGGEGVGGENYANEVIQVGWNLSAAGTGAETPSTAAFGDMWEYKYNVGGSYMHERHMQTYDTSGTTHRYFSAAIPHNGGAGSQLAFNVDTLYFKSFADATKVTWNLSSNAAYLGSSATNFSVNFAKNGAAVLTQRNAADSAYLNLPYYNSSDTLVLLGATTVASNGAVSIASGTLTASAPALTITQAWNNGSVTFNGALINITNTASAAASTIFDAQAGSVSRLSLTATGVLTLPALSTMRILAGGDLGFKYQFYDTSSTTNVFVARGTALADGSTLAQFNTGTITGNVLPLYALGTVSGIMDYNLTNNNTSTGSSMFHAVIGAGSSGGALIRFDRSSVRWRVGLLGSASDVFRISQGELYESWMVNIHPTTYGIALGWLNTTSTHTVHIKDGLASTGDTIVCVADGAARAARLQIGSTDVAFARAAARRVAITDGSTTLTNYGDLDMRDLFARKGTAIPAGGTAGAGVMVSSTANFGMFFGSGAPSLSAAKGSIYLRSDGSGTSDRMYVNTDGSTTWTNVVTAA